MTDFERILEERNLRYKDIDFFNNPIIGKEVVRFKWKSPKYREHCIKKQGVIYFDDFIMDELKTTAEKNNGGFSS